MNRRLPNVAEEPTIKSARAAAEGRPMKLFRHAALAVLLGIGFTAAATPATDPTPPHRSWPQPATPVEALIHQLDQAAALDAVRSQR